MPFATGPQFREFALDDPGLQPAADALGERYVLDQLIGEGAFARTYRGRDTRLVRTVAVKLLRSYYAADPAFLERFQREAQAAAKVDHPNVVHLYDYGGHDGAYYLVLQYVPGHDLKRMIEDRAPLPPADAIRIAREILGGLAAIHAAGIIHRDIKPQNVLIGLDGIPRVTDFGIAYESGQSKLSTLTHHGVTLGTPAYMAPEQARGETVSQATDIYSTGVVLFELLTGRLPFEAESRAGDDGRPHGTAPAAAEHAAARRAAGTGCRRAARARQSAGAPLRHRAGDGAGAAGSADPHARRLARPGAEHAKGDPCPRPAAAGDATHAGHRSRGAHPPTSRRSPRRRWRRLRGATAGRTDRRRTGWIVPAVVVAIALVALMASLVRALGNDGDGGDDPARPARR